MIFLLTLLVLFSLILNGFLYSRVHWLEEDLRALRDRRASGVGAALTQSSAEELEEPALEGLKIAVQIEQDHDLPTFGLLLKERFLAEDAETLLISSNDVLDWTQFDLLIAGTLVCNRYSEVFFEAALECRSHGAILLGLREKPPHGDRQVNLANTVVVTLKKELERSRSRGERRAALAEIGSEMRRG